MDEQIETAECPPACHLYTTKTRATHVSVCIYNHNVPWVDFPLVNPLNFPPYCPIYSEVSRVPFVPLSRPTPTTTGRVHLFKFVYSNTTPTPPLWKSYLWACYLTSQLDRYLYQHCEMRWVHIAAYTGTRHGGGGIRNNIIQVRAGSFLQVLRVPHGNINMDDKLNTRIRRYWPSVGICEESTHSNSQIGWGKKRKKDYVQHLT